MIGKGIMTELMCVFWPLKILASDQKFTWKSSVADARWLIKNWFSNLSCVKIFHVATQLTDIKSGQLRKRPGLTGNCYLLSSVLMRVHNHGTGSWLVSLKLVQVKFWSLPKMLWQTFLQSGKSSWYRS